MNSNEIITFVLDVVLIGASIWTVIAIRGLGGEIGKSLGTVTAGAVVLGLAHVIETLSFLLGMATETNEIVHRLIVLTGFTLLVVGFTRIARLK